MPRSKPSGVEKKTDESVRKRDDAATVGVAPVRIIVQQRRIADVHDAVDAAIRDDFGQASIASRSSEIETLARDRMQALCRVATMASLGA
jgi:hypothetical protein